MVTQDQTDDDGLLPPEWPTDPETVTLAKEAMGFGALAVDVDLAAFARALGLRACLEETADVEPDVESYGRALFAAIPEPAQRSISTLPFAVRALMKDCVCC